MKKEKKNIKQTENDSLGRTPDYIKKEKIDIPETESLVPFPMIKLLQALSPELDEEDGKYIKKAKIGDICITDGSKTMCIDGEKGIRFSPILVRKNWVEWVPRNKGGGFVASYSTKEEMEAGFTQGNEVNVSIDYLVISPDISEGEMIPLLLQFNSPTKMVLARAMHKYITTYNTMHGVVYHLTSKKQVNRAGQKFYNFNIEPTGYSDKNTYLTVQNVKEDYEMRFLPLMENGLS